MNSHFSLLELVCEQYICTLLLNAPPLNIITQQLLDELDEAFSLLEQETELRVVVIGSALSNIFCAGADIKAFVSWTGESGRDACLHGSRVFHRISQFPKPVLCAVSGSAFGGGLELAMACDIRIFDEKAQVALSECTLGMQPGFGGTQRAPRLMGSGFAKRMMFTGETVDTQTALRVGLADEAAPAGQCLQVAQNMARTIAKRAPIAVAQIKKSVTYAMDHPLQRGLNFENRGIALLCDTEDKQEGAVAFTQKRPPVFRGI